MFVDLAVDSGLRQLLLEGTELPRIVPGDLIRATGHETRTHTGDNALLVDELHHRAHWNAGDYKRPYALAAHATVGGSQHLRYLSAVVDAAWSTMVGEGYLPMMTDLLVDNYNGGSSIPIEARMGSRRLGYLRITMEERLLQGIGAGLGSVFQIGPIVKGGREHLFLEAYRVDSSVEDLLAAIGKIVERVEGQPFCLRRCRMDVEARTLQDRCRPELEVDHLERLLVDGTSGWVLIEGLPVETAPLYRALPAEPMISSRVRLYADRKFIADLGVQETDSATVSERLAVQRVRLDRRFGPGDPRVGDRDLLDVLAAGVPPCAGFSLRLDELIRRGVLNELPLTTTSQPTDILRGRPVSEDSHKQKS